MASLKQEIAAYKAASKVRASDEIQATMRQATEELIASGIEKKALKAGDTMPNFEIPNQYGQLKRLSDYLAASPIVLNIYRGGWCPYCNMEMKALHAVQSEIEACGARLVGMAPEMPDRALSTAESNGINIDILSDVGNRIAEKLGLVAYSTQIGQPVHGKVDSRRVATRGLFFYT